ncbi:MAG: lipoyl(octanoyl) transferase LipB [Burkholderiales bacterium]
MVRYLGLADYRPVWQAMKDFTARRGPDTPDELWLLQHPPVYTQGLAGKPEHLLHAGAVPVIKIDRGGQITYHGPGQIIAYTLLDLRRRGIGVKELVHRLEQAVIDLLADLDVSARRRDNAPGVYVDDAKIAALGLRIKNGCCYHGLSFNVDMDLSPFLNINPCGYEGLRVTQAKDCGIELEIEVLQEKLAAALIRTLETSDKPVK